MHGLLKDSPCCNFLKGFDVGDNLFIVTVLTLFMFFWIDIFRPWYIKFLTKRGLSEKSISTMMRILWVILTIIFWYTLLHRGMPDEFTITHFTYALFIFSLYGLIKSFLVRKKSWSNLKYKAALQSGFCILKRTRDVSQILFIRILCHAYYRAQWIHQ